MTTSEPSSDIEGLQRLSTACAAIRRELGRVIVGQDEVIEQLLVALLAGGHCLLIGVPGLAKTLMISSLAKSLELEFNRIQFTPDLMPADITGTEVIQENRELGIREFRFLRGPIFANIVLADEINRTPPKTQAALLEAMQERQVTVGGQRHPLPSPFFVLATQNPIEQEGTYPLPEAQLDRFMFNILVDYPSQDDELEIVLRTTSDVQTELTSQLSGTELGQLTHLVRRIAITPQLALLSTQLARNTRPGEANASTKVRNCVRWGAGPRASQNIVLGAKARASLYGSPIVRREDIEAVAPAVLRHRLRLNFQAEAQGITADDIIREVLQSVDESLESSATRERISKVLRS